MTQRHADSDDETYVTVGRPFELLETAEDVQKAKARKDKDQYVTDAQGRRRFHGAFTGGFSAGYYNTVGSKEGWTPSSFVSSRGKRTEFGGQRPEDFMDEEDFGAHGIAPKIVSAQEQFVQGQGEGSRKRPQVDSSVIPGVPPLENLIVPSKDSVGARLLKAMGWREGEGVGPKVLKYQPEEATVKVYGPARPGPSHSTMAEGFMFAPRDSSPWEFTGKDDLHGLGYRGMEEMGVLGTRKSTRALYGMRGEAFGTGALGDEDDDDEENVYGEESITSYDVSLAGEGDLSMEKSFGWTGRDNDTWDLSCFTKALKKPIQYKSHPPPIVPKTFVPLHKFKTAMSNTDLSDKPLSSADRSNLLANNSGSVFGLLSFSDRERLKQAAEQTRAKPDSNITTTEPKEQPVAAGTSKTVTEWESEGKDRMARAAAIFKPLGTSLASRFTRSQDHEEAPKSPESDATQAARAGMFGALTREIQNWHPHRILCKRFNVPDPYPGQSVVGLADGRDKKTDKNRAINFELTEKMVTTAIPKKECTDPSPEDNSETNHERKEQMEEEEEETRPPLDLFRAVFADSDSSASDEESQSNKKPSTKHEPPVSQSVAHNSNRQELHLSTEKRWHDLSLVASNVETQSQLHHSEPQSMAPANYLISSDSEQASNQKPIISEEAHNHKTTASLYGPSLPPACADIGQQSSDQGGSSKTRRLSYGNDREKHKKSHKKHKRDEREHKEHRNRRHKHSSHTKH